jgi:hypothetical protein
MTLLVPDWLIRAAVASVWLYEGVWCKLLDGDPNQRRVVAAVPKWGSRFGVPFLYMLGVAEGLLGVWAVTGCAPVACVLVQTALLVTLNANGLAWSRALIHDPAGMVVKNAAFLVLAWVGASLGRGA